MKRSTIRLLAEVSGIYFAILFLSRAFFPETYSPPIFLLVIPLFVVVAALLFDLTGRITMPSEDLAKPRSQRRLGRGVQELTRQIEVGTRASRDYYDKVLLARLRELLVEKVSLETGIEKERVREILRNKVLGPGILHHPELYGLLYSSTPPTGPGRLSILEKAVGLIEAWKP